MEEEVKLKHFLPLLYSLAVDFSAGFNTNRSTDHGKMATRFEALEKLAVLLTGVLHQVAEIAKSAEIRVGRMLLNPVSRQWRAWRGQAVQNRRG